MVAAEPVAVELPLCEAEDVLLVLLEELPPVLVMLPKARQDTIDQLAA